MYAEPYERPPAPARRSTALRRLLPRRRPRSLHSARSVRVSRVYSLLPGARPGCLSTVVYSDRYFLYGLSLHTCPPHSSVPVHYTPLPRVSCEPVPGGGVLVGAGVSVPRVKVRYGSIRRGRRDVPRVFGPPLPLHSLYPPPPPLPLSYRQPVEVSPSPGLVSPARPRCESPSPHLSVSEPPPRPEFARPDNSSSRPPSTLSLIYSSTAPYAVYEPYGSSRGAVLRRKVLNTERYTTIKHPTLTQKRTVRALLIMYLLCIVLFAASVYARPSPDSAGHVPLPGPGLSYGGIPYGSVSGNVAEYFRHGPSVGHVGNFHGVNQYL
ncbi:unnamed protein product [Danaus chrysippus]|uniref:(African queen) hypothetical protein n=1 Tax=Danaus chrysippus TaxID=151541 RepID=A0A8J2VQI2_9NEOP|nr:unnamed protein product [Danaus chrysippus]